jgi:hypothetical protein
MEAPQIHNRLRLLFSFYKWQEVKLLTKAQKDAARLHREDNSGANPLVRRPPNGSVELPGGSAPAS